MKLALGSGDFSTGKKRAMSLSGNITLNNFYYFQEILLQRQVAIHKTLVMVIFRKARSLRLSSKGVISSPSFLKIRTVGRIEKLS